MKNIQIFRVHFKLSHPVIARNEAIQDTTIKLDCFDNKLSRNDGKVVKLQFEMHPIFTITAALLISAAVYGQGQSQSKIPDNLLIVPDVMVGTNVLNQNGISDLPPPTLTPVETAAFARPFGEKEEEDAYMFHPDPNGKYYHFENFVTGGDSSWDAYWKYEEQFTASSTLAPSGTVRYDANNLRNDRDRAVGGDRSTTWCEGVKGYGIGERIAMRVRTLALYERPDGPCFTKVMVVNGYAKDEIAWKNNTRVKILRMYVNSKHWCDLHLADVIKPQIFTFPSGLEIFPAVSGKKIAPEGIFVKPADAKNGYDWPDFPVVYQTDLTFEIIEVYPGDKFDDTCITGIALDSMGGIY